VESVPSSVPCLAMLVLGALALPPFPGLGLSGMQHEHKRTVSVHYELTRYQTNQIKALGRRLWPGINLDYNEICRRVLLDAADQRLALCYGERLLEACCQPSPKASKTENQNPILIAIRS